MARTEYMKAAEAHRTRKQAEQEKRKLHEQHIQAAWAELEDRTRLVSFPDYEGQDSHAKIREDRIALEEYLGTLPEADEALDSLPPARGQEKRTMAEELAAIREQLDGDK